MSSYDQNLLDEAPKATRAQLQEGYNVDLLEQPRPPRRTSSVRDPPTQPPPAAVPLAPVVPETDSGEKFGSRSYTPAEPKPQTSFWRSRNGVIAAVLIVLVIVGAVVGGAVGGTVKKSNNNNGVHLTGSSAGNSAAPGSSLHPASTDTDQGIGGVNTKGPSTAPEASPTATGQNTGGRVTGR